MNCRQNFSCCKNNVRFNSLVTSLDSSLGLLFKIQRNFANPSELQVNWTLLRSFLWFTVEKRNYLSHGDLKNTFKVSIIPQNGAAVFQFMLLLLFEQIINARCTSVSIKLVLRFEGPNESQRKYCPVKVGFLKPEVDLKRELIILFFFKYELECWMQWIQDVKKRSRFFLWSKNGNCVIYMPVIKEWLRSGLKKLALMAELKSGRAFRILFGPGSNLKLTKFRA